MNIVTKMKNYRYQNNLTQKEFAKLCDLSLDTIRSIECRRLKVTAKTLVKLTRVIGNCDNVDQIDSACAEYLILYDDHTYIEFTGTLEDASRFAQSVRSDVRFRLLKQKR